MTASYFSQRSTKCQQMSTVKHKTRLPIIELAVYSRKLSTELPIKISATLFHKISQIFPQYDEVQVDNSKCLLSSTNYCSRRPPRLITNTIRSWEICCGCLHSLERKITCPAYFLCTESKYQRKDELY